MELGSQIAVPMPDWTIPWALLPAIPIPSMSAIRMHALAIVVRF